MVKFREAFTQCLSQIDAIIGGNGSVYGGGLPAGSCPPGTSTSFVTTADSDRISMNVVVPGGQQVYVGPDGALGYTIAHSTEMPENAISKTLAP